MTRGEVSTNREYSCLERMRILFSGCTNPCWISQGAQSQDLSGVQQKVPFINFHHSVVCCSVSILIYRHQMFAFLAFCFNSRCRWRRRREKIGFYSFSRDFLVIFAKYIFFQNILFSASLSPVSATCPAEQK